MKGKIGCIVYAFVGLLQLAAVYGAVEDWWGVPWWIGMFISPIIAFTPIVGTIAGIMGAIKSFGWSPLFAILLFFWPYVLYLILFAGGGIAKLFSGIQRD